MRAVLAGNADGTSLGLAAIWAGTPTYFMHSMGMGETIGLAVRASQNAALSGGTSLVPGGPRWGPYPPLSGTHTGLMGDPALRLHMVEPPRSLAASSADGRVVLSWKASTEPGLAGYHVFRSTSPLGPFSRVTTSPLAAASYQEAAAVGQTYTYLVKTLVLERTPGGTYYNLSQGTAATIRVAGPAAPESSPPLSFEPFRVVWQIGHDDDPAVSPYAPHDEFSMENRRADSEPGAVTRFPGDPLYQASNNPGPDDHYYCVGTYPVGFNGLRESLTVPHQEPFTAWERSLTHSDRTNRVHFILGDAQADPTARLRLNVEFSSCGYWLLAPVNQKGAGYGAHDLVIRFRNGAGSVTTLFSSRLDRPSRLTMEFPAGAVGATVGANSIELVRTGPLEADRTYWLNFDYLNLESSIPKAALEPFRVAWQVGVDDDPLREPYAPYGEFSMENGRADPAPGAVTRLPGDPSHQASGNPGPDDDYYCAGIYPAGFNGLRFPLDVPQQEPFTAWERSLTHADRTNRIHFILSGAQANPGSRLRLNLEFSSCGYWLRAPINQKGPGYGHHDVVIRFRNGAGMATTLYSNRLDRPSRLSMDVSSGAVGATAGANSIELVRTGPLEADRTYWLNFDYLNLETAASRGAISATGGTSPAPGERPPPGDVFYWPSPHGAAPGTGVHCGVTRDGEVEYLTITYTRPDSPRPDREYQVEAGSDLLDWSDAGLMAVAVADGSGAQRVTVRDRVPVSEQVQRFMRVVILEGSQTFESPNRRDQEPR